MSDTENTRTSRCIDLVQSIVKQHFDCLFDSGAEVTDIKEVAQHFIRAIKAALGDAVLSLLTQLKEKEDETN